MEVGTFFVEQRMKIIQLICKLKKSKISCINFTMNCCQHHSKTCVRKRLTFIMCFFLHLVGLAAEIS